MKLKSNFILGLATGVAICFGAVLLSSSASSVDGISKENAINDLLKGNYVSVQEADQLINAYSTNWIPANELPTNTTIGGVIGRANLINMASGGNSDLIKFRFYYQQSESGDPQIGLVFYPTETSSAVLKTGAGSFCPVVCTSSNE